MSLSIQINPAQIRAIERLFGEFPRKADRILLRAINKTGVTIRSRIVKGIAKRIAVTQKEIRKSVILARARRGRASARIRVSGSRIPLIRFGARETKRGVSYRISRSGGRMRIGSAFIARMRSGHIGVFRRKGKKRLPIVELKGPSVVRVFQKQEMREAVRDSAELLEKNVDQQVRLQLERGR